MVANGQATIDDEDALDLLRAEVDGERKRREAAEAASRAKDRFIARISHELRAPLNAVLGWTQLLRRGAVTPDEQARVFATIERNAAAQAALIEELLDVARIESGKIELRIAPVDLAAIARRAVEAARPRANAKDITLHVDVPRLPCWTLGDAARLEQIAGNLLSNALAFTAEHGHVDLTLEHRGGDVVLEVADDGAGIAEEFLPHVFEPFRQESDSGAAHGGLGLGLAIVRNLTEMQGGRVHASSAGKGRGARFAIALPAHTPAEEAQRAERSSARMPAAPPRLDGVRILVVSRDPCDRELLARLLAESGASVSCVAGPVAAIAAANRTPPDVLVCDTGPSPEVGLELVAALRGAGVLVPALALTSAAVFAQNPAPAGFSVILPMPAGAFALASAVARARADSNAGGA